MRHPSVANLMRHDQSHDAALFSAAVSVYNDNHAFRPVMVLCAPAVTRDWLGSFHRLALRAFES